MFNILWVCGYWQSLEIIRLNSRFAVETHFRVKTVIIIFSFGKYAASFLCFSTSESTVCTAEIYFNHSLDMSSSKELFDIFT